MLDIVGIKSAPHNTLVADIGFDKGGRSLELLFAESLLLVVSKLKKNNLYVLHECSIN